ncbi:unnamed protein product [Durusdinium trenchii]|uniref:Uncharacterized protein n=1 Tax=Durusdinium trenchii TaxID=1381693 RepID=A0ABP0LD11_9DINO
MALSVLACLSTVLAAPADIALVFESYREGACAKAAGPSFCHHARPQYLSDLAKNVGSKVALRQCPEPYDDLSAADRSRTTAVVGMPRNITILEQLPSLTLMQSSHYMRPI